MTLTERLDGFQQRHPGASFPLAVVYKFVEDQGNYLAALITYYAFLAIFPLMLLASSILGFILQGNEQLQQQILDSALRQFPIIGDQLGRPEGLTGSATAVAIGIVGSLYGAMGVAQATQNAMNIVWAVPRNRRPNPLTARVRSLLLLATAGLAIIGTTVLSALGSSVDAFSANIGIGVQLLVWLLSVALNAVIFMMLFQLATTQRHSIRDSLPGALTAAFLWQLLQLVGAAYVGHVVRDANATNGVFALVLGLIAWIYLGALTVVFGVEINVVHARRLYPRALLSPFTDNVDLTRADQEAYADYAEAQQTKGFESVDVSFENDGQNANRQRQQQGNSP
jgi:YihY family inner membrane protein